MTFRKTRDHGFTIAELLIAATITALIVVMLGTMFTSLSSTATHASERIDAFRDARAALQMIERDLTGLVQAPSSAYFALTNLTYTGDKSTISPPNVQIFALCSVKNQPLGNPTPAPGDVCAVGYYCSWDTNHYTLRRYFRDSVSTYQFFQTAGPGTYLSPFVLYSPASSDDVLAAYVWNLQVTSYKPDGTVDTTFPLVIGSPPATLPAAIEVSFNAMSASAAKTIESVSSNPNDWMDTSSTIYKRLIAPHAYQFRTRVNLP
jgi:type II secretory pathway pseudopilin PulG